MTYETLIFLFVAVVLTYFALVGILLHRELSAEAIEKRAKNQKASLLPSDLEYMSARCLGRERMLRILPMAVRYHFERLRPELANTGYRIANLGDLRTKRSPYRTIRGTRNPSLQVQVRYHFYRLLPYYRTCAAQYEWLQEQVRYHFYKRFPAQQTGHGPLDGTEYSELEEQVRFHFCRLCPTLETERELAG
jgi:hypothetical protein